MLAAVGIYGVLAYTVEQRRREIGIRMALGADSAAMLRMVMRRIGSMTLVGGVIGLVAALGIGRIAESMLYELRGNDPTVLGTAALLVASIALCAGLIPAYRASRVDPMRALRHE